MKMVSTSTPDPLWLFLNGHLNGVQEAERCLGVVEKLLLGKPSNSLLLGCKAALMLIVQREGGVIENTPLFLRKSLQFVEKALIKADAFVALQIRLMNGLAWARFDSASQSDAQVIALLGVLEQRCERDHIPTMLVLDGFVALSVAYQNSGDPEKSAASFRAASNIDRTWARTRYEFYLNLSQQRVSNAPVNRPLTGSNDPHANGFCHRLR